MQVWGVGLVTLVSVCACTMAVHRAMMLHSPASATSSLKRSSIADVTLLGTLHLMASWLQLHC